MPSEQERLVVRAEVADRPQPHALGREVDDAVANDDDGGSGGAGHPGDELADAKRDGCGHQACDRALPPAPHTQSVLRDADG